MTTLWARLKIWKAFENGEITEECAQYFDELLDMHRFEFDDSGKGFTSQELKSFNGDSTNCILGQIGGILKYDKKIKNYYLGFNVLNYIDKTTSEYGGIRKIKNVTYQDEPAYLANIIGLEFLGLDYYIKQELNKKELCHFQWVEIKKYLENTYQICAEKDDYRKQRVLNLISCINYKIRKIELAAELQNLENNPPEDEDADVIIHKIETLRKKIDLKDKEIEDTLNHTIEL